MTSIVVVMMHYRYHQKQMMMLTTMKIDPKDRECRYYSLVDVAEESTSTLLCRNLNLHLVAGVVVEKKSHDVAIVEFEHC